MKYVPLFNNILVKEKENKDSIIAYQEDQFGRIIAGEILEVSSDTISTTATIAAQPNPVKVGDTVYFSLRNAKSITLDNKALFVVDVRDILVKES